MRTDYRVLASPLFSPAHLARARRYSSLTEACAAMGEGVVVDAHDGGRIAAFHHKHLRIMERLPRVAVGHA